VRTGGLDGLRAWRADTAIVLGSGLSSLVDHFGGGERVAYADCGDLPRPTVHGHAGAFVLGTIGERRVIFAQGRVHLYEGGSARDVTACIRLLAEAGVREVILTNAAGAANPEFKPGSWMMLTDHLNLTGATPLIGSGMFVDLTELYSHEWREHFRRAAKRAAVQLAEGVYAGVIGPQYETPAEVRMLRTLGADAIGMSTVLEAIQARALGMRVAGFSCLTNCAAGMSGEPLSHTDVLLAGRAAAADFARLLEAALL
jgi:purine-nucleoside phosphorylase